MTQKQFWQDPYLTELKTKVLAVSGADVELAETIFFVESGGQESDIGWIDGEEVIEAKKDDQRLIYTVLFHDHQVGDEVKISINWERRYRLMKLHFAAEMILELIYQDYDHPEKIGAHISAEKARIDFVWDGNISETFEHLLLKFDELVHADLPIKTGFEDEANERRYWQLEGFAKVPCGGTHPRSTAEVGKIALKRKNPGQGRERIEIILVD